MHATQLTARSAGFPLADPSCRRRTWAAMRSRWPRVLAACLMGNHLHVLVEEIDGREEALWLGRSLRRMRGWRGVNVDFSEAVGRVKVRRDIRYIALNPCRAELCNDPLEWVWSTHREVFGAAMDPWLDRARLLRIEGSADRHHAYVSSDPHVSVVGTAPPRTSPPSPVATRPIADIARAALAATRTPLGGLRHRGPARAEFFRLAHEQGWQDAGLLARLAGVGAHAVRRSWREAPSPAARICLGDRRLIALTQPSSRVDRSPRTAARSLEADQRG